MKNIKFKSFTTSDFQGVKHFEFDFNKDSATQLLGTNRSGKSSIVAAILWTITSKNAQDQSDSHFQIVPLDSEGRMIHTSEPSGKLVIEVDGVETIIERKLKLKIPKTNDNSIDYTQRFKTERKFFINGLNYKATQFNGEIAKIFGEENSVKILMNVIHFGMNMSEKKQRELLLSYIRPVTHEMLCSIDERFKELVELEKLEFNDVLTQTRSKIKGNKEDLTSIKARIAEKKLDLIDFKDVDLSKFGELETKRTKVQNEIKTLNDKMKAQDDNKKEASNLERDLLSIEHDIKNFNSDFDRDKQMKTDSIDRKIDNLDNDIERCINKRERLSNDFDAEDLKIDNASEGVDELIKTQTEELKEENTNHINRIASKYEGSDLKSKIANLVEKEVVDTCHVCNQALPLEDVATSQEKIDKDIEELREELGQLFKDKEAKLLELNNSHKEELELLKNSRESKIKSRISSFELEIERIRTSGRENNTEKEKYILTKKELEKDLKVIEDSQPNQAEKDMLFNKKEKIEDDIKKLGGNKTINFSDIQDKQSILDDLNIKLNSKDEITRNRNRLAELVKDQKAKIKGLSNLEDKIMLLDAYLKVKNDLLSKELRKHFSEKITFKFLDYTQDGSIKDVFKLLIDGVPYPSANTEGQISTGIEMIKFFQTKLGISLPILIDNREAVVIDLPEMNVQSLECIAIKKHKKLTVIGVE
jgi:DNA repair exonuclease SbcCD ATPase subunit